MDMHRLAVLIALVVSGCATIGQGKPSETEEPIRTLREVVPVDGATGIVAQDGTRITVTATRVCALQERRVVDRVTRVESSNESPGTTWALAGAGAVLAGAGTYLIVDASNVHPKDAESRQYNPVGPGTARGIGIGTAVVGGALLAVAVVDAARASSATEDHRQVTKAPAIVHQNADCNVPMSRAAVALRLESGEISLGDTDETGRLEVDLDAVIDPKIAPDAKKPMTVLVAGKPLGDADPTALYTAREMKAWRAIDFGKCKTASASSDCDPLTSFLKAWPAGPHATSVRKTMNDMGPRLVELAEAEAWARVDAPACSKGKSTDSLSDVSDACGIVERFLAKYPYGAHSSEAKEALKKGTTRQRAIEARIEREAKAAEVAAENQARVAEAKELADKLALERALQAERARERQYRAQEQARIRAECSANCQDECILARMSGARLAACIRVCVRNRCSQE